MNKEYTYQDGRVRIIDENGIESSPVPYCDNLDQILVQENLVEEIENKIKEISEKIIKTSNGVKNAKSYIHLPFTTIAVTLPVCPIIYNIMSGGSGSLPAGIANETLLKLFGGDITKNQSTLLTMSPIFLLYGGLITSIIIDDYKALKKEEAALECELSFLEKQIILEKAKLEHLRQVSEEVWETNTNYRIVTIDDSIEIENLRNKLRLYYEIGYSFKKYLKYCKKGILEEKLKQYSEEEMSVIKEYLQEDGPKLRLN